MLVHWMCGICGRKRTHSSGKSLRGNKKTRLQTCSRSLSRVVTAIKHQKDSALQILKGIQNVERMHVKRSKRMITEKNIDGKLDETPKWDKLINVLVMVLNGHPNAKEEYLGWKEETNHLSKDFKLRESLTRGNAAQDYLQEVSVMLDEIDEFVRCAVNLPPPSRLSSSASVPPPPIPAPEPTNNLPKPNCRGYRYPIYYQPQGVYYPVQNRFAVPSGRERRHPYPPTVPEDPPLPPAPPTSMNQPLMTAGNSNFNSLGAVPRRSGPRNYFPSSSTQYHQSSSSNYAVGDQRMRRLSRWTLIPGKISKSVSRAEIQSNKPKLGDIDINPNYPLGAGRGRKRGRADDGCTGHPEEAQNRQAQRQRTETKNPVKRT
ncbi:hypothetical protein AAMO2058_000562200 [Amorphochlora amoebiformis]